MFRITAIAIAALSTAACASMGGEVRAPQPAKPVDLAQHYTGVWHEIGRRPMLITNGCVAGATEYKPGAAPNEILVRDTCRKDTPSGKEKAISGKATIEDPGTNAKLHVRYNLIAKRDYWVLDRADDGSWFISADPQMKDLYIYARDPQISDAKVAELTRRAGELGYDVSNLEFPAQPGD